MAEEDQRAAREADVAGGDRREAERGEGSHDSRHEQMDSCICSEGIRFLEAVQSPPGPVARRGSQRHWRGPIRFQSDRRGMIANVPVESFPPEVRHRLGWYVYRLIDPRNGETFQARVSPQLGSARSIPRT